MLFSPFCYLKKQFFFLRIWPETLHRLPGRSPGRFHPRLCSRSFSRILFGCDLFPVKPRGPHLLNRCPKVQMAGWRWSKAGAVTEATAGSASLGPPSAQAPGVSGRWHPKRLYSKAWQGRSVALLPSESPDARLSNGNEHWVDSSLRWPEAWRPSCSPARGRWLRLPLYVCLLSAGMSEWASVSHSVETKNKQASSLCGAIG